MRGLKLVQWLGAAVAVQLVVATGMAGLGSHSSSPETKVLGVTLAGANGGGGDSGNGKNNGSGNESKNILASGAVVDLFPGAVKDVPVLLRNRNNFDVVVIELRATVSDASASCAAANVHVDAFVGQRPVPKNGSATQTLVVRMHNDAPDACKSATWQLVYSGRAEKP